MAEQVIGSCSICGGDVVGYVGPWFSIVPPPPAKCSRCGAEEQRGPVIPMRPAGGRPASAPYKVSHNSTGKETDR